RGAAHAEPEVVGGPDTGKAGVGKRVGHDVVLERVGQTVISLQSPLLIIGPRIAGAGGDQEATLDSRERVAEPVEARKRQEEVADGVVETGTGVIVLGRPLPILGFLQAEIARAADGP